MKVKSLKRTFILLAALGWLSAASYANAATAGICTNATVGTTAVTVLPAYTGSAQNARRRIQVQMTTNPVTSGGAAYAWCTIGGTAANNLGYMLIGAGSAATATINITPATVWDIAPVQYPASTFPIAPSGQISCIASAASQTITACVW